MPGAGIPRRPRRSSTAIASFSVEAAGNRARAFQAAPAPVRRSWTKTPQTPGNAARQRANGSSERRVHVAAQGRNRPGVRGCLPGQAEDRADPSRDRRPRPSIAVTRIVTSRCGSETATTNRRRVTSFVAASRPSTRTRIRSGPRRDAALDAPERHLAGCGRDDHGWRGERHHRRHVVAIEVR